jgi:hypothetical protein
VRELRQYWVAPIPPFHTTDGTALASSTTLTDVSPTPPIVLPANTLEQGMEIELAAFGQFSTTATPTLLLGFYYGGVAGVALAASTAITTGTTAAAWPFKMRYRGIVRSVGTAGSIVGQGELLLGTSLIAFSARAIPETAAARTVAIDTTAAKAVTVGAQWGTSSASNTLTLNDISLKLIN